MVMMIPQHQKPNKGSMIKFLQALLSKMMGYMKSRGLKVKPSWIYLQTLHLLSLNAQPKTSFLNFNGHPHMIILILLLHQETQWLIWTQLSAQSLTECWIAKIMALQLEEQNLLLILRQEVQTTLLLMPNFLNLKIQTLNFDLKGSFPLEIQTI